MTKRLRIFYSQQCHKYYKQYYEYHKQYYKSNKAAQTAQALSMSKCS